MKSKQFSAAALVSALVISTVGPAAAEPVSALSNSPERIVRPVAVDQRYTFPVSVTCNYRADVRGTINPVANTRPTLTNAESEVLMIPNIAVDAYIDCGQPRPGGVHASALPLRPMTRAQVERALDRYATARASASGCTYRPDFELHGREIVAHGIASSCGTSGSAHGGGPSSAAPSPSNARDGTSPGSR